MLVELVVPGDGVDGSDVYGLPGGGFVRSSVCSAASL